MKPNDALFRLIKSMNRGEKRHFKLYSARYTKEANYLKLFEAIGKQKTYNEAEIKRQFRNYAFVKRLTATKQYLYDLIMQGLGEYHLRSSPEIQLSHSLIQVEILKQKDLHVQAKNKLSKIEQFCKDRELYVDFLTVLAHKSYIVPQIERPSVLQDFKETLAFLQNEQLYLEFEHAISSIYATEGEARTKEGRDRLLAILNQYQTIAPEGPLTNRAKISYYAGQADLFRLLNDRQAEIKSRQKVLEAFACLPSHMNFDVEALTIVEQSQCFAYLIIKDLKNAKRHLLNLRQMKVPEAIRPFHQFNTHYTYTMYCSKAFEIDILIKSLPEYHNLCRQYPESKTDPDLQFTQLYTLFRYVYGFFLKKEFTISLKFNEEVLKSPLININHRLESQARMLLILIHYELGNLKLLPYLIRSTARYLSKHNNLYAFEKIILRGLSTIAQTSSAGAKKARFQQLFAAIKKQAKDPIERVFLSRFDWIEWVESKILGVDLLTMLQSKKQISKHTSLPA